MNLIYENPYPFAMAMVSIFMLAKAMLRTYEMPTKDRSTWGLAFLLPICLLIMLSIVQYANGLFPPANFFKGYALAIGITYYGVNYLYGKKSSVKH